MTISRRSFLSRLMLASGGLLVGDAAMEAFERLTHRKVWALGGIPVQSNEVVITLTHWREVTFQMTDRELALGLRFREAEREAMHALQRSIDDFIMGRTFTERQLIQRVADRQLRTDTERRPGSTIFRVSTKFGAPGEPPSDDE